jgi:hypothetical protein
MMKSILLLILVTCGGCAAVGHLDEALTLKAFSQEKDAQDKYVQAHDAKFEDLLRLAQQEGAFKRYTRKASFVQEFGEPIVCRADEDLEKCLYRRIVKPAQSPKVYLYFSAQGDLVRWEFKQ